MAGDMQIQTPAATLFQKAHGKIVILQRLDAQLAALIEQRKKVQEELTSMQGQINAEFVRLMNESNELPTKMLNEAVNGGIEYPHVEHAEAVA